MSDANEHIARLLGDILQELAVIRDLLQAQCAQRAEIDAQRRRVAAAVSIILGNGAEHED